MEQPGDPSFRETSVDTPAERLGIAYSYYNHQQVAADSSAVLPIGAFQHLVEQGIAGGPYPWPYSFMGYLPQPR